MVETKNSWAIAGLACDRIMLLHYHAPQKHCLPESSTRIIFEITVARLELISKIAQYPLYLCELHDITRLRPLSFSNYFYYRYPI